MLPENVHNSVVLTGASNCRPSQQNKVRSSVIYQFRHINIVSDLIPGLNQASIVFSSFLSPGQRGALMLGHPPHHNINQEVNVGGEFLMDL